MTTEPTRPFGECVYTYATASWAWSDDMYLVAGLARDADDPSARLFERMHPDDRPGILAALEAAIEAGGPLSGQYRLRDDTGRQRVISFVGDGERADDGTLVRLRGFAFDVTDAARRVANDAVSAATADRAAIEQVKGALMFAYGIDADAAFDILKRYSQRANVRVAVLARRAVARPGRSMLLRDLSGDTSVLQVLDDAVAVTTAVR